MASVIPSAPLGTDAAAGPFGLGAAPVGGPGGAAAERRFHFELAAHPGSPAQARRLTRSRLTGWSVGEDTCDSAALVVSELVTNAILHTASTHIVCELHDGADLVRIAVRDEGCAPGEPHLAAARSEEEHGRGLFLVDALCRAWGAQEHGPGLLVWAELPREAAEAVPSPRGDLGWGARPKPGPSGGSTGGTGTADEHDRDAYGGYGACRTRRGIRRAWRVRSRALRTRHTRARHARTRHIHARQARRTRSARRPPSAAAPRPHGTPPRQSRGGGRMAVGAGHSGGRVLTLDTVVRLRRGLHTPAAPRRLPVPEGMTAPWAVTRWRCHRLGPLVLPRLPRVGCVYADDAHWWWIVPSDSDYALEW